MAKIPIEIFNFTKEFEQEIVDCIETANKLQNSIEYSLIKDIDRTGFKLMNEDELNTESLFDEMEKIRNKIGGFHPYLLMINDKPLYDDYYNIFGNSRASAGLGVFTTSGVYDAIIPKDKMKAYFIYYLARYTLDF